MVNPNLELIRTAARQLSPVLDELVFVGGCATGLLITDEAAAGARPTFDVDAICEVTSYAEYIDFSERLRALGFSEDAGEGAPLCRWRNEATVLDVMPLDERILGFSNRWYTPAMRAAHEHRIADGVHIRVVTAPYFCATKLEAFAGRGGDDYVASHDLEDLLTVIDGRIELTHELRAAREDVRSYVAGTISRMLQTTRFIDALPGHLLPDPASQGRIGILLRRLQVISELR